MRIGIDLGGTKIEGIALDDAGRELARRRVATPRGDYNRSLATIVDLVQYLEAETGARGTVGVGMPGTVSPLSRVVKNANSVWLNGRAFDVDLQGAMGRDVRFANDANCLAVSEATDGAGVGAGLVFGVILGTGVGGGIAVGARVHQGSNHVGGEWGHNQLPWMVPEELPGPECYCGKRGCIETWVSGVGFAKDHERVTGEALAGPDIVRRARDGDNAAEASIRRYEDRLGRALAHVVNLLDPDVIVLGGGLSNLDRLYDHLPEAVHHHVFGGEFRTPIRRAAHGDSSGVRGAAWLWPAAG